MIQPAERVPSAVAPCVAKSHRDAGHAEGLLPKAEISDDMLSPIGNGGNDCVSFLLRGDNEDEALHHRLLPELDGVGLGNVLMQRLTYGLGVSIVKQ